MNNTNPFVPQGSLLEQQSKRRSRLKLAVFCVLTVSVTGLTAMLIQGCKREQPTESTELTTPLIDTNLLAFVDTNTPAIDTNIPVYVPPVVVPPPVIVPESTGTEYAIVKGDTFDKIAKLNRVSVKAIEAANPGVVPTKLRIGQKIIIPSASATPPTALQDGTGGAAVAQTYTVKSGDTLTKIAKLHGTTVKAIQAENNLATTTIYVGKKLKIPAKPVVDVPTPMPTPMVEPAPAPFVPATGTPQ